MLTVWHRDWIQFKVVKQTAEWEKAECTAERYHKIIYSILDNTAAKTLSSVLSVFHVCLDRFKFPDCKLRSEQCMKEYPL